jgi:hypothetical protein
LQENFDRFNNALYKEKEMADFRRCIIVLAALALLLGTVGTVSLQAASAPLACISSATPAQMRAEGLTEKGGDFVLTCTGGNAIDPGGAGAGFNPANQGPMVNIQIFLNTNVTSRILTTANNATEALLLIDEPSETQQTVCVVGATCPVYGNGGAAVTSPYLIPGAFNVFQGQLAGSNSIVFNGVPILPPGTAGGNRVIRITNIRADANELGVVATGTPLGVTETIATSNSTVLPVSSNNASQVIGFVQKGLIVTTSTPTTFQQCFSVTGATSGAVTLSKGFGAAFKIRNIATTPAAPNALANQDVPGTAYNTETFFYNNQAYGAAGDAGILNGAAGIADFGTRFRILFTGVNAGVTLTVPLTVDSLGDASGVIPPAPDLYAVLVTSEGGAFAAATSGTISLDSSGDGEAVYEVLQANTSNPLESLTIPFTITYTANPGANSPALGTNQVAVSFAPVSTDTQASAVDPIPRFADTSTATNHFSINQCATHLLFPFATNQAGFDTGIALSNTSQDPYGTSTQTGICTLNFYGANAPAAYPTPAAVAAGTTWTTTVSAIAPNFQGYLIVDCEFQYAHGFAFVTQVGTFAGTMGYLPLIIPDPPRSPNPFDCPKGAPFGLGTVVPASGGLVAGGPFCNAGSGEQLAQ